MISNYMMGIKPQTSCTFINFPSVNSVPADSFDTNSKKHRLWFNIHVMQHPLILTQINEPHRLGPKKATYVPMVFAVDNLKVTYMYYMWYNF